MREKAVKTKRGKPAAKIARPAKNDTGGRRARPLRSRIENVDTGIRPRLAEPVSDDAAETILQAHAIASQLELQISFAARMSELCDRIKRHDDRLTLLAEKIETTQQTVLTVLEKAIPGTGEKIRYQALIGRIRQLVRDRLPADSTVLVVSKGDEDLLDLGRCRGWHFPQDRERKYPGYYPADSGSAIVQLEALRAQGADYLLIPQTSLWWLEHYGGFRRHLERFYERLPVADNRCALFSLRGLRSMDAGSSIKEFDDVLDEFERRFDRLPNVLDWNSGIGIAERHPHLAVFSPPADDGAALPYCDQTADIVAVCSAKSEVLAEARRVATAAVVIADGKGLASGCNVRAQWLRQADAEPLPTASIVIPSYNGISLTENCLRALAESLPRDFRGEIIVVDDCSTDDTAPRLEACRKREPRLKVIRNLQNCGFVVTCNNGATAASGDVVILLNNDTLPQRGWLEPLLRLLRDRPDAGAVGGKLVYPDGRLQEAGGIVYSDGSTANFGKWQHALDDPLFNYVREVDYVTGALIATRRDLFNELGQLDTRYRPIYYEETDYCFRLRQQGYKIYYHPESVVIHLEGVTCGTDMSSGTKRYQAVNREKFRQRWRDALRRQPPPPPRYDMTTWHELASPLAEEGGDA
jgi:GT2 family glycosyltransferase